jgi:hypothetical protein
VQTAKFLWVVLVAVMGVSGTWLAMRLLLARDQGEYCMACKRPVHLVTKTVAIAGGRKEIYCCPMCALSDGKQRHIPVKVVTLTDYDWAHAINADTAFIVRGSDVNPCLQHAPRPFGDDQRPMALAYDRCTPSIIAFAKKADAEQFARAHGGQTMRWVDFAAAQ